VLHKAFVIEACNLTDEQYPNEMRKFYWLHQFGHDMSQRLTGQATP
jgi:hypothetical protein